MLGQANNLAKLNLKSPYLKKDVKRRLHLSIGEEEFLEALTVESPFKRKQKPSSPVSDESQSQ